MRLKSNTILLIAVSFGVLMSIVLLCCLFLFEKKADFPMPESGRIIFPKLSHSDMSGRIPYISFFDLATGTKNQLTLPKKYFVRCIKTEPSGNFVFFASDAQRIMKYDPSTQKCEEYLSVYGKRQILYYALSANRSVVVTMGVSAESSSEEADLLIYDNPQGFPRSLGVKRKFDGVSIEKNGNLLVYETFNSQIVLFDIEHGTEVASFPGLFATISWDGRHIAYCNRDNVLCIYDIECKQHTKTGFGVYLSPIVWSPDGEYIAFYSKSDLKYSDTEVSIYSLKHKQAARKFSTSECHVELAWIK